VWHAFAWAIFGAGYVGAIVFVAVGLDASAGDVLLVLAAGARLSTYIGATVGEIGFLRGTWLDGSVRLAWLEDYAASFVATADARVPELITDAIRFDHVTFAYPGTTRAVLGRRRPCSDPSRRVAVPIGRRIPGFLPFRVAGAAQRRRR
jgi:ATP-binding cassette subfamily B protein